ncbi:MAG: GNAT family N-acetyltransferase [Phycisphaeraceae bacterium]|nr:MAG: GNAT family N-acetyltransferase [Phycisphaeraceae bacterium]
MACPIRITTSPSPAKPVEVGIPTFVHSERLTLRPLLEADRDAFVTLVRENAAYLERWIPLHEPGESDSAYFDRQFRFCEDGDAGGSAWRRVGVLDDGSIVGCFHLNSVTRGLAWEADATWWVGEPFAGRGLASEGVAAMLAHAFRAMPGGIGLHSVHCGVEPGNLASRRVAEKCGFRIAPGRHSYLKVGERWVMHDFYLATPRPTA